MLHVNAENLARDLETGLAQTDAWFAQMPQEYLLRTSVCGLVSTAIQAALCNQGVRSELLIADFGIADDVRSHVFPVVTTPEPTEEIVVDAAYSQFYDAVGLTYPYAFQTGKNLFPTRKVVAFEISRRSIVTRWFAVTALQFQEMNSHPKNEFGWDLGRGPLAEADKDTVRQAYAKFWDLSSAAPWAPTAKVENAAKTIATYIQPSSIYVE